MKNNLQQTQEQAFQKLSNNFDKKYQINQKIKDIEDQVERQLELKFREQQNNNYTVQYQTQKYQTQKQTPKIDLEQSIIDCKKLIDKKEYQKAQQIIDNLLKFKNLSSDLFYLKAEILRRNNDFKQAEDNYLKCFQFERFTEKVFLQLAICYTKLNNLQMGNEMFKKYRQNDDKALYLFSKALFEQNNFEESLQRITQALSLKQEKHYYLLRMQNYKQLNQQDLAEKDLTKFLKFV